MRGAVGMKYFQLYQLALLAYEIQEMHWLGTKNNFVNLDFTPPVMRSLVI